MKEEAKSSLFLELIPQLKESRNCLEKVVLLTCRSARKRNRIARSLGEEGNKNACRCKGKGIESSFSWVVYYWEHFNRFIFWNYFLAHTAKGDSILFPLDLWVFLFPSCQKLRPILFPSPTKVRAILFLFCADLRARSTTFSRKWLNSFNWRIILKNY